MKDSKLYTDKIQKWYRAAKRIHPKVCPVQYEDPIDAVVVGLLSEQVTEKQAALALKRMAESFVDLNDFRVAQPEEIVELLGPDNDQTRQAGVAVTSALMALFNKTHNLSLIGLKKMGKRPAKQALEALDGVTRFAVSYTMLTSLQGHAVPLTPVMVEFLKTHQLVHAEAGLDDIEGFLEKQVASKEGYEFYALLRADSEAAAAASVKTAKAAKKKATKD